MEYINTALLILIACIVTLLAFRGRSPKINNTSSMALVICDSSALIDGRILEVARSGFMSNTLVVPSSVLREMQYLADNSDHDKRARARHGLDIVKELQQLTDISVEILDDGLPAAGGVDERLVTLCKSHNASLLTLDFNLNKVAAAEGITVLNINQLAQSLRMSYLPGERRSITLVQKGQDNSQAVGYLEDGTMVVVEKAGKDVGSQVEVEFTRALQTQAGKMLFAKKVNQSQSSHQLSKNRSHQSSPKRRTQQTQKRLTPEDNLVKLANKE